MNLLVTGGAGFIGSNFVHYWTAKHPDDKVIVYDKLTYAGNIQNLNNISTSNYKFVEGDILDQKFFEQTIRSNSIDTIVHFAAETHVDRSIDGPETFIQTNIIGTYRILELLRKHPDIRLHHVSTDEVFGNLPSDKLEIKFTENFPYNPRSPYSASKASSDHLVRAYTTTYGIKATISNCSNNYGPYCFPEKLIPLAITRAINNEEIPVYGNGKQIRDWIHVEDHVRGIDLILKSGKLGETYLLGGNGERENTWIVNRILKILNKPKDLIVFVGDRKGHDHRYAIDYTKAKTELGFEPLKSIDQRLDETVRWYTENEEWWKPLKPNADQIAEKYLSNRL